MNEVINNVELSVVKHNADERIMMKINELELEINLQKQNTFYNNIWTEGEGSLTVLRKDWYSFIDNKLDAEKKIALEKIIAKKARKVLRAFWGVNVLVNSGIMALITMINPWFSLLYIVSGIVSGCTYFWVGTDSKYTPSTFENCANVVKYEKFYEKIKKENFNLS